MELVDFKQDLLSVSSRKRNLVQKVEVTLCCSLTVAAATVAAAQFRLEKKKEILNLHSAFASLSLPVCCLI